MRPADLPLPIALGAAGALTGIMSWIVVDLDLDLTSEFLGVFFGAAVGGWLVHFCGVAVLRALGVVAVFGLSWQAAVRFALWFNSGGDDMALTGVLSGAIGAAVLVAGMALLFSQRRNLFHGALTVAAGAVAGALLGLDSGAGYFLLFVVWQAAVGASLGLGEPLARRP